MAYLFFKYWGCCKPMQKLRRSFIFGIRILLYLIFQYLPPYRQERPSYETELCSHLVLFSSFLVFASFIYFSLRIPLFSVCCFVWFLKFFYFRCCRRTSFGYRILVITCMIFCECTKFLKVVPWKWMKYLNEVYKSYPLTCVFLTFWEFPYRLSVVVWHMVG